MSLNATSLKDIELKTGASAGDVLEKIRRIRESNMSMDKIGDTNLYISGYEDPFKCQPPPNTIY